MSKWFAFLKDRDDNDWGMGSSDYDEAQKMVINHLSIYPDGHIAIIEEGPDPVCLEERYPEDFDGVYYYAARIVKAKDWDECKDDLDHLMYLLDMEDEWESSESFEDVIRIAGHKIGIELV